MTTLVENVIVIRANNHPPMLEKSMYNSWQICKKLYIRGKEHGKDLIDYVLNGPFQYGMVVVDGITRGLPSDVYNLVSHHIVAKEIWDRFKLLMEGTKVSLQEREGMFMQKLQVNKKFVNKLQPEWSKFVTYVKLARDMHESNFDQLYAYLKKHEVHANEVKMIRKIFPDPFALVANYHHTPSNYNNHHSYDDPIASLNKAMTFINMSISSRYPTTNNQLRTSSNLRNQATVQDDRVIVIMQLIKQGLFVVTTVVEKILLVHTHESWVVLDAKQLAFLADLGISKGQDTQTSLPINVAFQTDDHDAFDLNCDEAPFARAVLMANLSSYDSDVLLNIRSVLRFKRKNIMLENERLMERCSRLENRCTSLEIKVQQSKESFQNNRPSNNQDTPESHEFFMINELKAQLKAKESSIIKLKTHIATLKGKCMSDSNVSMNNGNVIAPGMFRLDLEPLSPKLKKIKEAHVH
ncbi:hypothetical protein Tco_1570763 [Tanacetum coccineum]